MNRLLHIAAVLVGLLAVATPIEARQLERTEAWPDKATELFGSLPLQEGGRVKPLSTFADFTLLGLSGKRSLKLDDGDKLTGTAWLMDVLFFPRQAATYPAFLVQDDAVLAAIGVRVTGKKRRDRYSFDELRPGIERLYELAHEYSRVEEKARSTVEQQVVILASNVDTFTRLAGHLDYAHYRFHLHSPRVQALFDGAERITFSTLLERAGALRELHTELMQASSPEVESLSGVLQTAAQLAENSTSMALFPPLPSSGASAGENVWLTPGDLFETAFRGGDLAPQHLELMARFEQLSDSSGEASTFSVHLAPLHEDLVGLTEARGEYGAVRLEGRYYRAKLLTRSLAFFLLSFVAIGFVWLRPKGKWLYRISFGAATAAVALTVTAIVVRCVIRGRPPVSTLYETVLFVTACGVLVALFMEAVNRQRIALSAAAILGVIGLFVANGYEALDKRDTMPSLVAVLDTNFWLATHVTAITLGYAAGMLAALMASLYILARVFGLKRNDRSFYRHLSRMVYGVVCFAVIFSVVGTILGGIWANESWGRFWGWDPKENGALLIVISQIAILHARMGGYLREFGICLAAAFGGTVIAFSWWGVNLLGVGLHSYGFTSGIHTALWTYYGLQWSLVAAGGVRLFLDRRAAKRPAPTAEAAEPEREMAAA